MSDYASVNMNLNEKRLWPRAVAAARSLVAKKTPHILLLDDKWVVLVDAQRFLSLYMPDSIEQSIFSYFDESKTPRALRAMRVPMLVLLAEKDEYADRPAQKIAAWFEKHTRAPLKTMVIPRVRHSFKGGEKEIGRVIRSWITAIK